MATIVTRAGKGASLSWVEADANFTNLNTDKAEISTLAASGGSAGIGFIQSGTGAVARTVQDDLRDYVSVKQFGAVGDGVTNDTSAIAAALAAHLNVYFPPGTYDCGQLSLRSGHNIIGAGPGVSIIQHRASTNAYGFFGTAVSNICIKDLSLDGNSANNLTGGMGIRIEGASSNIQITNCRIFNWRFDGIAGAGAGNSIKVSQCTVILNLRDGVSITGFSRSRVSDCDLNVNGRYGAIYGPLSNDSTVIGCTAVGNGENGLAASGFGSSLNNIKFIGDHCNSNTQYGINCVTVTNVLYLGNTANSNGVDGLGVTLSSPYAVFKGNNVASNGRVGLAIDSESHYSIVSDNISVLNGWEGIAVFRSTDVVIANNKILNNGARDTIDPDPAGVDHDVGILVYDTADSPNNIASNYCEIIGNTIQDTGAATQNYGVRFVDTFGNSSGAKLIANRFAGHATTHVGFVAANIERVRDNSGFVTQNEGTGVIASGDTSVVISHGLSVTPTAEAFSFTLTSGPTNAVDMIWVSSITSTQFTVNVRTAPGAGGLNFRWKADAY